MRTGLVMAVAYDDLGRQQCVTDANGSQANCNPSENTTASTDLVSDYRYDYLDRLQTYRAFSGGSRSHAYQSGAQRAPTPLNGGVPIR